MLRSLEHPAIPQARLGVIVLSQVLYIPIESMYGIFTYIYHKLVNIPYMDPVGLFKPHVPHTVVYLQSLFANFWCTKIPMMVPCLEPWSIHPCCW